MRGIQYNLRAAKLRQRQSSSSLPPPSTTAHPPILKTHRYYRQCIARGKTRSSLSLHKQSFCLSVGKEAAYYSLFLSYYIYSTTASSTSLYHHAHVQASIPRHSPIGRQRFGICSASKSSGHSYKHIFFVINIPKSILPCHQQYHPRQQPTLSSHSEHPCI